MARRQVTQKAPNATPDPAHDLEVLFGTPEPIVIGGRAVVVSELELADLARAIAVVRKIESAIGSGEFEPLALLEREPDIAIELIAVLSHQDEAWVRTLKLNALCLLLIAGVEANEDFFSRTVWRLLEVLTRAMAQAGAMSSPSSRNPATA